MQTEAQIQQQIFNWYHNNHCLKHHNPQNIIFSVPNESSNAKEQMYKKTLGLIAGVSDLIIITDEEVLFVEVKSLTGKQSLNQIKFQSKVEKLGYRYIIVRSIDCLKKLL